MSQYRDRLDFLLQRYADKSLSAPEREELSQLLLQDWNQRDNNQEAGHVNWEKMMKDILGTEIAKPVPRVHLLTTTWFRYAAAIIVIFGMGAYLWYSNTSKNDPVTITSSKPVPASDIGPGKNKAILTLADGSTIVLDSAANGTLARQGNTTVIKQNDQIIYGNSARGSNPLLGGASSRSEEGVGIPSLVGVDVAPETFNAMSTPRGGQYQLVLPDGSRVWLNAASSITYPTAFTGKKRNVTITGEVYFEVAKDKSKPFFVTCFATNRTATYPLAGNVGGEKALYPPLAGEARRAGGGQVIEVLGTHFNVNAYADEATIKTTLLEGAVKVSPAGGGKGVALKPGQQSSISAKSSIPVVQTVDIDQVIAWKNGKFQFGDKADIQSVMRQISRWYDVDIEYEGTVKANIGGSISRSVNVSKIFQMLETTGNIRFRLEGEKVIVMPYHK